jgi:hypothetical protein
LVSRRISNRKLLQGCAEPGPGDGIDPRWEARLDPSCVQAGRKTLQLCSQIQQALQFSLAGHTSDLLRDLEVASVVPTRGKGRLLVTLCPAPSAEQRPLDDWLQAIARFASQARAEAAAAIHRRKVPELVLRLQATNES